ncbi:MAG: IS110 family transposase, partial [Mesorhizobium sp.]
VGRRICSAASSDRTRRDRACGLASYECRQPEVPSIGPVGSAMLVMKTPDPAAFKSGRQFAAWVGLTPKDHSTAGRQRLGV